MTLDAAGASAPPLSPAVTRYLLTIYQLSGDGSAVRSVDVAAALGVARASVSKLLHSLAERGLILKEYYGNIRLTAPGIRQANELCTKVLLLENFFQRRLGLESALAHQDAVASLCFLSVQSTEKLAQLVLDGQKP